MTEWFGRLGTAGKAGVVVGGLAAVALAAFIVVNALSGSDGTAGPGPSSPAASVSPTMKPSVQPDPTQAPSPSPTPAPEVVYGRPHAAIVLVNGLNVRAEPVSGDVTGALDEGEVVTIQNGPQAGDGTDWYLVHRAPDVQGWVSAGPADDPFLDVRLAVARNVPATVEGLAAGPAGYVAWGQAARTSNEPRQRYIATSPDGATWTSATPPEAAHTAAFIWVDGGPTGWLLAASNDVNTDTAGIWRSDDGVTWDELGAGALPGPPQRLIGYGGGYALAIRDDRTGTSFSTAFTSADGLTWRQVDVPNPEQYFELGLVETATGIVVYGEAPDATLVLSSTNGTSWTDLSESGAHAQIVGLAVRIGRSADELMAISRDIASGAAMVWRTEPAGSGAAWIREPGAEAVLGDALIEQLVGTSDVAFAFGHSFDDGRLRAWQSSDGATWQELDASGLRIDAGITNVVAGPSGLVAVGHVVTAAGPNPVFLRATGAATWEPEASPVLRASEHAVVGACPEPPTTMIDWLGIPDAVGAECFGNDDIAFVGYVTQAGGCGGLAPGIFEPQWLANPFARTIVLEPNEAEFGGCGSAVPHPAMDGSSGIGWATITGHWADPAAADCRVRPDPETVTGGPGSTLSPTGLEFACRTRFVATSVVAADPPR